MKSQMKSLISVSSLSFAYENNQVLENISFEIKENDFIAMIGPNGSGKTTLIKILLGFLAPTSGTFKLSISRNEVGYVPQKYTLDKNFPGTVEEILDTKNQTIIGQAGVGGLLKKKFIALSGGQQQRVLIALALKQSPKLLVLDEPTAGVDINAQQSFYELLRHLNKQGITIIIVTHEVGIIPSLVKKVLCINHKICCLGTPEETPHLLKQIYGPHFVHHHHSHYPHKDNLEGENND